MKKRRWIMVLLVAAAIILCACGKKEPEKPPEFQCEEVYKPTLEEFYDVIAAPLSAEYLYDGLAGVYDAALAFGDEALDKISYTYDDVNGDGKEEVFIGCFEPDGSEGVENEIYAAFTHNGFELIPLFEKQNRNTFALTDTGTFYFYGSDGAKYHILAEYELNKDGELVCKDFYFTYPKDGDGNHFCYYHNTTGVWDPEGSEEIQMTPEELEALRKALAEKTVPIDGVKFSEIAE